jgi:GT2 family glycosyltransferase
MSELQPALVHEAVPMRLLSGRPSVDILVPFHGQYDHVTKLLESLFKFTPGFDCEVMLIDDASPNISYLEKMAKVSGVKTIRATEHRGFGASLKLGFEATERPWIAVVQSDVVIEDAMWLREMYETLQKLKTEGVKMVGARTDNPLCGDLRAAGDKGSDVEDVVLTDTTLPLHCFLCHRELFPRIGGFIKEYPYAQYEDEELAFRMRKHGFKQAISGRSWVHHEGEVTVKYVCRKDQQATAEIQANYERCMADIRNLNAQMKKGSGKTMRQISQRDG